MRRAKGRRRGRLAGGLVLAAGIGLTAAPSALAANVPDACASGAPAGSICLTQYSKTVSGVAPGGATSVKVSLMRTPENQYSGGGGSASTPNVIDSFTATPGSGGAWTGSFPTHTLADSLDEVEVSYTGTLTGGYVNNVWVGSGTDFVQSGDNTSEVIPLSITSLDNGLYASGTSSGATSVGTVNNNGNQQLANVAVNGTNNPNTGNSSDVTLSSPAQTGSVIVGTITATGGDGTIASLNGPSTVLNSYSDPATTSSGTASTEYLLDNPSCDAYLVLNEVVCYDMATGQSYSISNGTNSATLTVPGPSARPGPQNGSNVSLFVPDEAGTSLAGLAPGQKLTIKQGSTTVSSFNVDTLSVAVSTPLGDLLNGANTTVTGTCVTGMAFDTGDVCGSNGQIPTPNNLFQDVNNGATTYFSELDENGLGYTDVLLPNLAVQQPSRGAAIFVPFQVTAMPRYTDPVARSAADDTLYSGTGQSPVVPSVPSSDTVTFSYAPVGTTTFTTLGNVNTPGGLTLPATLPAGEYDGQWTIADPAGNSETFHTVFNNEGPATVPGPSALSCTRASGSGYKVTLAMARMRAARVFITDKKKKKKSSSKSSSASTSSVSFTCSSSAASPAGVALWLSQGSKIVASGSGTLKNGAVKVNIAGPIASGTYQLVEIVDSAGKSTESNQVVTIKAKAAKKTTKKKSTKKKKK